MLHHLHHSGITIKGTESCHVAILHLRDVHLYYALTFGTFHPLCQSIRGKVDVWHHPTRLEAHESRTLSERPCLVDGIVVPLPVDIHLVGVKLVARHNLSSIISRNRFTHHSGNLSILIAEHRPSVLPCARHESEDASASATILENHSIPVALTVINDCSLGSVWESTKRRFQYHLLLVWTLDIVGTIYQLAAGLVARPRNHDEIILAVVLDDTATFKKSVLFGITLKHFSAQSAFLHSTQVGKQLLHLSCAIKHVCPTVVIEEERGIVEMGNTMGESPSLARVLGGIYISLKRNIVGGEIEIV